MSADLCEELIVEIFTRLPAKSLLRFRSVSKWLCVCIGSPSFIRLHTLRSPNKAMIMHQVPYKGGACYKDVYTFHSKAQLSSSCPYVGVTAVECPLIDYIIVGSCNGIMCLYAHWKGIYLWNPSIRRKLTRPLWGGLQNQPVTLGFGFDPTIDDYKILKITSSPTEIVSERRRSSSVYTMKTNTWREIAPPTAPYDCMKSSGQCLFNGALHWVVRSDLCHLSYVYIMTFDLRSEVFSKIELPKPCWETEQLTVINGCLAVISVDKRVWVRKEVNNNAAASWAFAFKLNTEQFVGAPIVYQLTTNDDLLMHDNMEGTVLYNPKTQVQSRLVSLDDSSVIVSMFKCVESLELLDVGTSCDQEKQITGKKRSRAN